MRVLFYNWADAFDPAGLGGGVTVYQRNLIEALRERNDVEVHTLFSGLSYDLRPDAPLRWERIDQSHSSNFVQRFRIVNSAVIAPAHAEFGSATQVHDDDTRDCFLDFLDRNGSYDVVHFNNLEGLPASVLSLKRWFPDTKVIFSLHNYYPFCAQVNLWHKERDNCLGPDDGRRCVDCVVKGAGPKVRKMGYAMLDKMKAARVPVSSPFLQLVLQSARRIERGRSARMRSNRVQENHDAVASQFAARSGQMVKAINDNCDWVLCVSESVRRTALRFGIVSEIAVTSYIGTKAAEEFSNTEGQSHILNKDGTLTFAYLGYVRRDKGFFFLLEALEQLPRATKSRLRFVLAARGADRTTTNRLSRLRNELAELQHWDGYNHNELDCILKDVKLGVVPVLWRDNLPQTAIEMHARHIPLLTSHLGGAKELSRRPDLVFKAGNHADLGARLTAILDQETAFAAHWRGAKVPPGMRSHVDELMGYYTTQTPACSRIA